MTRIPLALLVVLALTGCNNRSRDASATLPPLAQPAALDRKPLPPVDQYFEFRAPDGRWFLTTSAADVALLQNGEVPENYAERATVGDAPIWVEPAGADLRDALVAEFERRHPDLTRPTRVPLPPQ